MPHHQPQAPSTDAELRSLCTALHLDIVVVNRFIVDYLHLLDARMMRIDHDLTIGDTSAATVALLSLGSSSTMVGAEDVAEAADRLRRSTIAGNDIAIAADRQQLQRRIAQAQDRLSHLALTA